MRMQSVRILVHKVRMKPCPNFYLSASSMYGREENVELRLLATDAAVALAFWACLGGAELLP